MFFGKVRKIGETYIRMKYIFENRVKYDIGTKDHDFSYNKNDNN